METLNAHLKVAWISGDYSHFAKSLVPSALEFLARIPVPAETRMLDVQPPYTLC